MAMDIEVRDVPERQRYEATVNGVVAGFISYGGGHRERIFRHTEVAGDFEGKGVGGALARAALDDLRARGLRVRPLCPFVAAWIGRHPEYLDLVVEDYRSRVTAG
jgi:hypothetical protein